MEERYSLNEQTYQFILQLEKDIEPGEIISIPELVNIFETSIYNKQQFNEYKKPKNNSIWWALTRSEKWIMVKPGVYQRKKTKL